jgi:glycosyltransferase involved in cell wall biosynthesis
MNIAYFSHLFTDIIAGPARLSQHLKSYNAQKNRFVQFTLYSDSFTQDYQHQIKIKKHPILNRIPLYWIIRSYQFYSKYNQKKQTYDAIICSNAFEAFIFALMKPNIPLCAMINDYNYVKAWQQKQILFSNYPLRKVVSRLLGHFIEKWVTHRCTYIIAASGYTKKQLIAHYHVPEEKISILYNAIDLNFWQPRNSIFFSKPSYHLLFLKNDWRTGGLDLILKGLGKLSWNRDIIFTVGGLPKKDFELIKNTAVKAGFKGKLCLKGIISKEEYRQLLYDCDLYILLSRNEALGLSLLEAMATGTPVLSYNTGGIPEALNYGKSGILLSSNQPEAIAETLNNIKNNPEALLPLTKNALQHVKKFSQENLFKNLENIFQTVKKSGHIPES